VRDGQSTPAQADNSTIVVLSSETPVVLDADFAYLPPSSENNSVGDTIWRDADADGSGPAIPSVDGVNNPANSQGNDGAADVDEVGIGGVTVDLVRASDNVVVASTLTNADGQYLFTSVPDGDYIVRISDQNSVLTGLSPTFDSDGVGSPNQAIVSLDPGGVDATPVDDRNQDFGYVDNTGGSGLGVIGDTIFFDENNDGLVSAGEGLEGVTVQLFGPGPDGDILTTADNVLLAIEVTNENGTYLFTGLDAPVAGLDYQVVVDVTSLPNGGAGWVNTVDPDTLGTSLINPGDSVSITTLSTAEPQDLEQDFGYLGEDQNSLSGTVFSDSDGDGEQNEAGVFSGVTVEIRDSNGNIIRQVTTDVDGNYEVNNLPDGVYTVVVTDENNVLSDDTHTDSPNGVGDQSDRTSKDDTGYVVDLDSAGAEADPIDDATGDFGYRNVITNPISLSSFTATAQTGGRVRFEWATQTEVANLGFKLYERVNGEWQALTPSLILAYGDSVSTQQYKYGATSQASVFAIADIDINGKETLHGPFQIGRTYGQSVERKAIDWQAEELERKAKGEQRQLMRRQQQIKRLQRRLETVP